MTVNSVNTDTIREQLHDFEFAHLFIESLGWSNPGSRQPEPFEVNGGRYIREEVAELARVKVFKITAEDGKIPNAAERAAIQREIARHYHENLLIFVDGGQTRTLWHWGKRENGRVTPREHLYMKGQPGDLFLSKISGLFVDISELDEQGDISVVDIARRLRDALDIERVTRTFYEEYRAERERFIEAIDGIGDERERAWYASVMLNRLMFVYFLQKKRFLDRGDLYYLQERLNESRRRSKDRYFDDFLKPLFFEGFAKPKEDREPWVAERIGDVPYLGGSVFMPHAIEEAWPDIAIPDGAFERVLGLFGRYSWNLDDTPGADDRTINPDVLGYIFEKYINQKAFGAYYTPTEITEYLCEQTIHRLILARINTPAIPGIAPARRFETVDELLMNLDNRLCRELLREVLPNLTLLDPACGSGAFLIAALKTLVNVYAGVIGQIEFAGDADLQRWLDQTRREHHGSVAYYIRKKIIAENLYGVDIMPEAIEIATLRLYLALVSSVNRPEQLEPLPNIDFNLLIGNSLIGMLRVDEDAYNKQYSQMGLFSRSYGELVAEKNRLIASYRDATSYAEDLRAMRDEIEEHRREANERLNEMLLDQWNRELGIKFEEATWDVKRNRAGKAKKRALRIVDIEMLQPFHWGYEFSEVMNQRGGFDAIITNPPWEILKPNAKEFLRQFNDEVTINKMTIKELQQVQAEMLQDPEVREAWRAYMSGFPHQSAYFRSAAQYANQISVVNGRKQGTDINLYKLFTEQCFNLLRDGGECGIVIPSGIYTDLGAMQLRRMLFERTRVTGLFGFENRRRIFDNVDSRFKFVVLTFEKGGRTESFPAAFMRHDVEELKDFPRAIGLEMPVALIERLSPDSLSVMEFKSELDVRIARKMTRFPLLGEHIEDAWNLVLTTEFHMTNDSDLFETEPGPGRLPLFTGRMFHQFELTDEQPIYWIPEDAGRSRLAGRQSNPSSLEYQLHRWVHRRIARNTDTRTFITTITPKRVFTEINSTTLNVTASNIDQQEMIVLTGLSNSFVLDWLLRLMVTTTINMFYVYQLPVPRLTEKDPEFGPIVERAARLICTTPEFDGLAREAGLRDHRDGVTDPDERAKLRAELDGIIAHLYGLTEDEFTHILSTFPLVDQRTKDAALEEFRKRDKPASGR